MQEEEEEQAEAFRHSSTSLQDPSAVLSYPSRQVQLSKETLPSCDVVLTGHSSHVVALLWLAYDPSGHEEQTGTPSSDVKLPALHGWHPRSHEHQSQSFTVPFAMVEMAHQDKSSPPAPSAPPPGGGGSKVQSTYLVPCQ